VEWATEIHARNAATALRFMEGLLRSSDDYVRHIGRACLLTEVRPWLERLLRALVGYGVRVGSLESLDSDALLERGSRTVCMYRWLYLPSSCSHFDGAARNRSWYTLAGVCAAGMLAAGSFPRVHGHRDYRTCADLVGGAVGKLNLFTILECARVLERVRTDWPGAAGLLARGLAAEFSDRPARTPLDRLFLEAAGGDREGRPPAGLIRDAAARCRNAFDAAELVNGEWGGRLLSDHPDLGAVLLRPVSFLPDFGYPGATESTPPDSLVLDLREDVRRGRPQDEPEDDDGRRRHQSAADRSGTGESARDADSGGGEVRACYVYDEWSHPDGDYYRDYCLVHESRPEGRPDEPAPGFGEEARRVRRAFELLKPDAPRREKRLPEGEVINHDRLLDFVVQRRREPSPPVDFYERPRICHRDVATLILLDVSGSTGVLAPGEGTVIDCEKEAVIVLAQALASLGDRFAVCGFSGQGREGCRYWVYKDFEERWDQASLDRVLAARPATGTRIGAALRHSGYRLAMVDARQRLVLLVTDGKPLDADYDPNSRYAQYDVRKACQENQRRGINVICISTDEESRADLGIMFPRRRYTILRHIRDLPQRLASVYIRATR
jgi:hypothetical protein